MVIIREAKLKQIDMSEKWGDAPMQGVQKALLKSQELTKELIASRWDGGMGGIDGVKFERNR